MRVFISEADKQNAKRVALANIAKFYDLRNWQSYNNDKLLEMVLEIPDMPTNFKNYLQEYFTAYDNWYKFYEDIKKDEEKRNEEYELNLKEREVLAGLIKQRQETLDRLQKAFDQAQFRRFQQALGLENVEGIDYSE